MNENIFISIVIPNLNQGKFLSQCIDSILDQKFNSFEISLDDSHAVKFGDDSDFTIAHDGSNARLINTTGNLQLFPKAGEYSVVCIPDAAVELYYDNTKICETDPNGLKILGPEGGQAEINLFADEGDDNADKWRVYSGTSNDFYITGVQLEIGEKATEFEHEPYQATLSKCLRYYQKHVGWIAQFNRGLDNNYDAHVVNNGVGVIGFMRAAPTETIANVYRWDAGDSNWTSDSTAFSAAISSSSQTFVEGYYGRQDCNAVKADWELIAEL